jgi:type IV secretion system protein VirD4
MNHDQPVSLYLLVPPSDINRTRPLIRMILNQVVCRLTETMQFRDGKPVRQYKHRLLLLLDEFPALGRLDAFEAALAFIAGYGLKALLVIQSMNQLSKTYFVNNSIIDNCHVRIVFTPNDGNTPEFISRMLGTKTEAVENQNYSGHRLNVWLGRVSITTSQTARPLLTPGEVLQLPKDKEIIFVGGCPPILAGLVFYYRDKNFMSRLREAPVNSDVLIYKPKDNLLVSEFSLDTAFPGADVHKIRKMPEYKYYFPGDEKEIEEIKNYAAGKAQISSSEQIPFAEEY